jgi:hypothetical protein
MLPQALGLDGRRPAKPIEGVHNMRRSRRVAPGVAIATLLAAIGLGGPARALAIPGEAWDPTPEEWLPLHHAPDHWIQSPIGWQMGTDCVSGLEMKMIGSWVAFSPTTATGVDVGDVFHAAISAGVAGTCKGAFVAMRLALPPGTRLAVDQANPVRCLLYKPGAVVPTNVTDDPDARCPVSPIPVPGGAHLGQRLVANANQFIINVPLRASSPISAKLIGQVETDQLLDPPGQAQPEVSFTAQTPPPAPLWEIAKLSLVCVWNNPANPGPC